MLDDGRFACMRFQRFALDDLSAAPGPKSSAGVGAETPRLICPVGFLEDSWWHRAHWTWGTSRVYGDPRTVGTRAPAGLILSLDADTVFGYGRKAEYFMWTTAVEYRLFAASTRAQIVPLKPAKEQPAQSWLRQPERQFATRWSREVPLYVRAMVAAGPTLLVAGPPNAIEEGPPETFARTNPLSPSRAEAACDAWEGRSGAMLLAVSADDGQTLAEYRLDASPVFDGMAAAGGRLFLADQNGTVSCWGPSEGRASTSK